MIKGEWLKVSTRQMAGFTSTNAGVAVQLQYQRVFTFKQEFEVTVTMCSQCCKISKVQNGTNRNPPLYTSGMVGKVLKRGI